MNTTTKKSLTERVICGQNRTEIDKKVLVTQNLILNSQECQKFYKQPSGNMGLLILLEF